MAKGGQNQQRDCKYQISLGTFNRKKKSKRKKMIPKCHTAMGAHSEMKQF